MKNNILHVDMDAFFAAVEQLDDKSLRGKPVIVGGVSERGVASTCSYEARLYGVHSAMPIFIAQKICPNGIYIKPRFQRYKEVSNKIFDILKDVTDKIEPISIDEAYLNIEESIFNNPLDAANYIKKRVFNEVGLTISIGISYNKFLAKLASDWNKPNGIKIIDKEMIPSILMNLSISKIHGLGKKSVKRLNDMGIFYIKDLYEMNKEFYIDMLGRNGLDIYNRIRGIDEREVKVNRDRKSYGKEITLKVDTDDKEEILGYIKKFCRQISDYAIRENIKGRTVVIKYKTFDFKAHTRSKTLNNYIDSFDDIYKVCCEIIESEYKNLKLRLIGVTLTSFKENKIEQLSLF